MKLRLALCAAAVFGYAGTAAADTTSSKWQSRVVIAKQGVHCVDDPNCFNRLHPEIPTVARARPEQVIVFETRDAADSSILPPEQTPPRSPGRCGR